MGDPSYAPGINNREELSKHNLLMYDAGRAVARASFGMAVWAGGCGSPFLLVLASP